MKAFQFAFAASLLGLVLGQTSYSYVACNVNSTASTQSDSYCRNSGVPLSCCAQLFTSTKGTNSTTNSTSTYACLPSDFVTITPYVDFSSTVRYYYQCPWSTTTTPSSLGGTASDLCPGGAIDPCAMQSFSCCATVTSTINGVSPAKATPQICIDKQYSSVGWQIKPSNSSLVSASITSTMTCLPRPNPPASSSQAVYTTVVSYLMIAAFIMTLAL